MNVVAGIGWITPREYGCVRKRIRRSYPDVRSLASELQRDSVFLYPVKRFGKYDAVSKMTCCVAALALHDAAVSYSQSEKQDMGILGTNTEGCLQANVDYFKDFVENGRSLGRANLFVYTLPSIPMAEAAIYFNCRGPLLYMAFPERQIPSLLGQCARMILQGESPTMLAVKASEEDALCFVVKREESPSTQTAYGLEQVMDIAERTQALDEMIGAFADL
jgi:hypothetical protein